MNKQASMDRIRELIEKVKNAASSEKNLSRTKKKPTVTVGVEDPIAWTIIFDFDANTYYNDPYFYVEQVLRQKLWRWENIGDDTPITSDIQASLGYYPEYTYLGMEVRFNSNGVPVIQEDHPLTRNADMSLLEPVDFMNSGWMPRLLAWHEKIKEIVGDELNVVFPIWWRGCLDLAIQLRGYENFINDTMDNLVFVHDLLKFITEQRRLWYEGYCRYFGCKMPPAWIGDDWINIPFITPGIFSDFVLPRYLEMEKYHGSIEYIHSCGNQTPIQKYLLEIKTLKTFEAGPWSDLSQTLVNIPKDKHIQVILHPNDILYANKAEMEAKLRFITESCSGRSFNITTSGLTPTAGYIEEYIEQIRLWIDCANNILNR